MMDLYPWGQENFEKKIVAYVHNESANIRQ